MMEEFQKAKQLLTATFAKAPGFDAGADFGYMYGISEYRKKLERAKEFIKLIDSEDARQLLKELQN